MKNHISCPRRCAKRVNTVKACLASRPRSSIATARLSLEVDVALIPLSFVTWYDVCLSPSVHYQPPVEGIEIFAGRILQSKNSILVRQALGLREEVIMP